jgi:electron-transferring-flavoprotein dehydrogenase
MEYDVVIVGAGPSGLACAIRLMQMSRDLGQTPSVCVLEKASEVGAHILAGAVIETRALDELLPDWSKRGAPLHTPVSQDQFLFLTQRNHWTLPTPPGMQNHGNFIVSLGQVCKWLASEAEALGVEIYPGFAAAEILYDAEGAVAGVATGDMGLTREGQPGPRYQPGMELRARQTLFAEGSRGSLTRQLMERFQLDRDCSPQTYGIGIKELWEIHPSRHATGRVVHTVGWPLDAQTYGGSWIYHQQDNIVSTGFVVGLDYRNPYLSPFEEFQRFKNHPSIRPLFEGGRRIAYGARALSEGGWQAIPKLSFPGGLLIGDTAGFLNVPKIKGTHTAMKSGMVAAEAVARHLSESSGLTEVTDYRARLENSWLWSELRAVRNIRPAFRWGLWPGLAHAALDTWVFRGQAPWTLRHHPDHTRLKPASQCQPIHYGKPDGIVSFDRPSSVFLANTAHEEDQPVHLKLADPELAIKLNLKVYDSPESRYCPAGVYEIVRSPGQQPRLQINGQNCVHCKTCDIKDPAQNIRWTVPEGGSGPNYPNM